MSQTRKKPCKFFNTSRGCRKGQQCPDSHVKTSNARGSAQSRPPFTNSRPSVNAGNAPHGKCNFYWSTGSCKFGYGCKYGHDLSPSIAQQKGGSGRGDNDGTPELGPHPLLAPAALSNLSVSGGDTFRDSSSTLDLHQANEFLKEKKFLRDDYRFRTTAEMCSFAMLLAAASSLNKKWTSDDGQVFLVRIASENGCLRLSNILSHEKVSSTSHYDPSVLSFQRGYLPVFQYLSSKFVVKSTLGHLVNALFSVLHSHLDQVLRNLETCINAYMMARSFKEKVTSHESSGAVVFGPIVTVLYEYLTRFKTALATHKDLGPFVVKLEQWIEEWATDICSPSPRFGDLLITEGHQHARELVTNDIKDRLRRVVSVIEREQAGLDRHAARKAAREAEATSQADAANLMRSLEDYYEGPGDLRCEGPRHDNDFVDIRSIKVAPTDKELLSGLAPFLPANLSNAPHPFAKDSMQRLLDIQFRLLREELLAPLRKSVQVLAEDMEAPPTRRTQLDELRKKRGGRYNYQDHQDSVMFNVYTSITFSRIEMDSRRGLVVELQLDSPPGSARSKKDNVRSHYWANGKRLMMGGLVAILWKRNGRVDVHLAILSSSSEKLAEAARKSADKLLVRVQFFDSVVNFKVLEHIRDANKKWEERFMIESSVMFETVRPFLESLKRAPEAIPFGRYLPHPLNGSLRGVDIRPPKYSTVPGFSLNLECLRRDDDENGLRGLRLVPTDRASIEDVRTSLRARGRLDNSQAEAMVDSLTREISLIQGPPGTGKTFIGVELVRVLLENNIGPILLIAFTNHALDSMLSSIIEKDITTDIVRLGGRSKDEAIKRYSIEELEKVSGRSNLDRAMKSEFRSIKSTEEETMSLLKRVIGVRVPSDVSLRHISVLYPDHATRLQEAPSWIQELHLSQVEDGWQKTNERGNGQLEDKSLYGFWKAGHDLQFLRDAQMQKNEQNNPRLTANRFSALLTASGQLVQGQMSSNRVESASPESDSEEDPASDSDEVASSADELPVLTDAEEFLLAHGVFEVPQEPVSDRPVEVLLEDGIYDVWSYSSGERARVDSFWTTQCRELEYQSQKRRFESLVERHEMLRERQRCRDDEIRLNIVRKRKLIGCTTTGAARLISMLNGLAPRVMIVEEAGQVLESHVLGSLVDSVEHLVLIGDPRQLRPTLNNYALSMDNLRGGERYRFDMSLMERLSSTEFPMTRLDVQRRMRPSISSLIRDTLYPKLLDHDKVLEYPPVRGMAKDVFFLTHGNKEVGGGDDSVSKHNPYEVSMIKDLVKYLLRQGKYSSEGSIVVLCTYLGQLSKVRDSLKGEMTVVIDERDQEALAQHEGDAEEEEEPVSIERVHVTQKVRIRSVDNYQGEEADIVILSLVRNSGGGHESNEHDIIARRTAANIGFLRSENRTNVALSRAKHGLYILGNAPDFASRSKMWSSVITKLESQAAVGEALPVKCHRHPDEVRYISKPGDLPKVSPDGGCLRNCGTRLSCGHNCPYKCHPDDENHRNVFCSQPCTKLCPKGHPCRKQCAEPCRDCKHPILNVELPCGHVHKSVPCHQMEDLSGVKCMVKVRRELPTCEHSVEVSCSDDIRSYKCRALCDGILPCCGKSCKAECHVCQDRPADPAPLQLAPRTRHRTHNCGRPLYCSHECSGTCAADHKCQNECQQKCRQKCPHAQCKLPCSKPCPPCQEPCTWICAHRSCPLPCGSVCARLPCDSRCEKTLSCGHRCPSVCGEDCSVQKCLECTPKKNLTAIADFILQRSLADLDPSQETLDELIITLPDCKHTFTVETLDGHCQMAEYYERDDGGRWRSLKMPPYGFKAPPTCPTCRCPIRSPRYGRVYKRADLDIVERNTAAQLNRTVRSAVVDFNSVDKKALEQVLNISTISSHFNAVDDGIQEANATDKNIDEARKRSRIKILNSEDELPVGWNALEPSKKLHPINPDVAKQWSRNVKHIKSIYERAYSVAYSRSPHLSAWESSFASLYRQEMDAAVQNPLTAPRHPTEHAMRMAKLKIGLSKPLADKRFCVEAFWLTLEIRFLLATLAQEWLKPGRGSGTIFSSSSVRTAWSSFVEFILKTCERDAKVVLRIAEASQSRKQALRSKVLVFQSRLESLKFAFQTLRKTRDELVIKAAAVRNNLDAVVRETNFSFRRAAISETAETDFANLFADPMSALRKELLDLEEAIRRGTVYVPVSYEEKMQVMRALVTANIDLTYSGHFYQCPNGHPYVIGDCGGASQTARCPECYEPIGGSGHTLLATNRRDNELEAFAREQGTQDSPWPWAR